MRILMFQLSGIHYTVCGGGTLICTARPDSISIVSCFSWVLPASCFFTRHTRVLGRPFVIGAFLLPWDRDGRDRCIVYEVDIAEDSRGRLLPVCAATPGVAHLVKACQIWSRLISPSGKLLAVSIAPKWLLRPRQQAESSCNLHETIARLCVGTLIEPPPPPVPCLRPSASTSSSPLTLPECLGPRA